MWADKPTAPEPPQDQLHRVHCAGLGLLSSEKRSASQRRALAAHKEFTLDHRLPWSHSSSRSTPAPPPAPCLGLRRPGSSPGSATRCLWGAEQVRAPLRASESHISRLRDHSEGHRANQRTRFTVPATRRCVCLHFTDEEGNRESQSDSPEPT